MKKTTSIIIILMLNLQLVAQFEDLTFGTDSTLDVVSWNIEHFPKNGQITFDYVCQIIEAIDVDVLAIQEITDNYWLQQLAENLDGWEGYYAYNEYAGLAYVYKTNVIENVNIFEIYTNNNREFPRSPVVMEMNYKDEHYVIINNHLKCCGDGYLDLYNYWDEEKRRLDACNLLDQYIIDNYSNEKVIVLGDLNDILTDSPANNVFQGFTDDNDNYMFVDMEIAEGSSSGWSYPSWPSHIDHILITNELFDDFGNEASEIQTIKLDEYFENGFYEYDQNVSDHRPVGLKIKTGSYLGLYNINLSQFNLSNYPNPFQGSTTFSFDPVKANSEIEIYNMKAQKIQYFALLRNQSSVIWNAENFPAGVYYAKLVVDNKVKVVRKIVLMK
ncbi:MAG: endonuclease/exonuclease/phosphatase family protein [Bacteroidetes bacterium]|nr:endonuclease/exonuclease/phosphatase family protein [Bacteroidota bacterium]MBL6944158.1 endonuclease/exonuclease/phosphatase family protein [Bacteroidales bacterium]